VVKKGLRRRSRVGFGTAEPQYRVLCVKEAVEEEEWEFADFEGVAMSEVLLVRRDGGGCGGCGGLTVVCIKQLLLLLGESV
jgi:hypothetical protein